MPRKIGFTVISSSSHEDNCGASELMIHAPTVNGWRSSRLCSYPQHITLQLVERCRVRKLQLLAHQYLISSKVEFHIGDSLPENSPPGFPGQLRRLGYVSLSDNEKTGFKSRELKSVHVDAIGTYLRITFHRNHVNRYNQYDQVALVAINVLGDTLDSRVYNTLPSREQLIEYYLNSSQKDAALDATLMGKCESISPLDDLAFDMYQDPEVAHIIRLLDQKKQDMLRQGNNERSKNLKQAIADLQKVGERLAKYDVEKQCAMDQGDFEEARKKKEQIEQYRKSVYQQLEVHNLLDMAMVTGELSPVQEASSLRLSPGHRPVPAKHLMSAETSMKLKKDKIYQGQPPETGAVSPKCSIKLDTGCTSAAVPKIDASAAVRMGGEKASCVPYDERPLPAFQREGRPVETPHSPAEQCSPLSDGQWSPHSTKLTGEPEPLTQKAQGEAGFPIEVYGETLVAAAYSKSWSYREHAILAVCRKLLELPSTTPREKQRNMIRAAVSLLKKALLDKVASVFFASLKLLRLLLSQLIPSLGQCRAEVTHCLEQTWPNLLARTGESAGRICAAATTSILEIAVLKDVRALQVIPGELAKPFRSNFPSRLAQSRVWLVEKLLAEVGAENSGFTLDNVMKFCTAALEHSTSGVREVAVRIILSMYQQHGAAILGFLPPSGAAERKFFLYKTLFDGFAKIDGKLVETQTLKKGGGGPQDAQMEKEEIHSLQEQLAALKELTEQDDEGLAQKKEDFRVDKGSQKPDKDVPANKRTNSSEPQESVNDLDNLCIFCGKKDESFTEDGLDLHYWKHCPMLRRCGECRQVVEIASLTEHLLGECDSRSKFKQCPHCCEAVAADVFPRHIQSPACNPPTSSRGSNHCPLCHSNFPPGEEAWKAHLMGREGCKQNARRAAVSQRTQPAQVRAAGGAKLKQAWSVGSGARARPGGRGSRIPALARGHTRGKH